MFRPYVNEQVNLTIHFIPTTYNLSVLSSMNGDFSLDILAERKVHDTIEGKIKEAKLYLEIYSKKM